MIFPKRKPAYSQKEISEQIRGITELQDQRATANAFNNIEEVKRCDIQIELMQRVLERMLEKVSNDK